MALSCMIIAATAAAAAAAALLACCFCYLCYVRADKNKFVACIEVFRFVSFHFMLSLPKRATTTNISLISTYTQIIICPKNE